MAADGLIYVASNLYLTLYALDALTGQTIWKAPLHDVVYDSPAVANGLVYIETDRLHAFNASTGAPVWTSTAVVGATSPAVANGVLYINAPDNSVHALDAGTGQELWSATTGSGYAVFSSPTVVNGMLYTGGGDGNLHAFGLPPELMPKPPARPDPGSLKANLGLSVR